QTADGVWAGHHPRDSKEAIAQLKELESRGGQFLLFPETGLWWLDHYEGLREHLDRHADLMVSEMDTCVIYALNGSAENAAETGRGVR
ncbi:MAG TPA: hypothetical protein VFP98_11020, partial [Candidatus Polarisedimenticolia bacterium]|nr:hypothetical protein [Candidatus Polarisedimenticolia bacterium]